jgi:hypothetical protein
MSKDPEPNRDDLVTAPSEHTTGGLRVRLTGLVVTFTRRVMKLLHLFPPSGGGS